MVGTAFTAPIGLRTTPFAGNAQHLRVSPVRSNIARMSVADVYIAESAVRSAKQMGAPGGVYAPQCTEGAATGSADERRVAVLSREFRLRQAPPSVKYADLFATRREALCQAGGAHFAEASIAAFPATASARVLATRESALACDRYFGTTELASEYMHQSVVRQYAAALSVPGGVYSTRCADGAATGQAEEARIAALAVKYRASMLSKKEIMGMRYNASLTAIATSRGCTYEEQQFLAFPKMASAMKGLVTGAYAASVGGASAAGGTSTGKSSKVASLAVLLKGENAKAIWPSSDIRKAVTRKVKPWEPQVLKDYSYMSQAALAYGIEAQSNPYVEDKFDPEKWSPGWKPKNKVYSF